MIYNGEIDTSEADVFLSPLNTNGSEITLMRVVNESAAARTFTLFIDTTGTSRAITPVDTQLPIGACFDDLPVFQIRAGSKIRAVADAAGVSWTLNAVQL